MAGKLGVGSPGGPIAIVAEELGGGKHGGRPLTFVVRKLGVGKPWGLAVQ